MTKILTPITLTKNIAQGHWTGRLSELKITNKTTGITEIIPAVRESLSGRKVARFGLEIYWKQENGKPFWVKSGLIFVARDSKITPDIISKIEKLKEGDYMNFIAILAPYKPKKGGTRAYYMLIDLLTTPNQVRETLSTQKEREFKQYLRELEDFDSYF
jgi:hypothetical protein